MDEFNPDPVMIIELPEQIKAFTDPLRVKVLRILAERAATNQQIADVLGQPHAKVLYHIRFLVDVGLIKLVDTQIKGGNVEKYYRALANIFDLRPPQGDVDSDLALVQPALDSLWGDMIASVKTYPDYTAHIQTRRKRMTPAKASEFIGKLRTLLNEYGWDDPAPDDNPDAVETRFAAFLFRDPGLKPDDD
ncbi:MAG: winged helix-turn-helix domain-containing protein [Chloroflexota bacterium]